MTNYHMETLLKIHDNQIIAGIALTEESPPKKHLTFWTYNSDLLSPTGCSGFVSLNPLRAQLMGL